MDRINAAIIDNEVECIELRRLLLDRHPEIQLLGTADSMASGRDLIQQHEDKLNLLFLDIRMPDGDGFMLLQHLRKINFKIIFTTGVDQFASRAFKFPTIDYLLKPVDADELAEAISKLGTAAENASRINLHVASEVLSRKKTVENLAVATLTDIRFIPLPLITYMESDNNYTTIHLEGGEKLVSSKNIGYYETLLNESGFLRISNYHLVNVKKIHRFIKTKNGLVELNNGKQLGLSTGKKVQLFHLLGLS